MELCACQETQDNISLPFITWQNFRQTSKLWKTLFKLVIEKQNKCWLAALSPFPARLHFQGHYNLGLRDKERVDIQMAKIIYI